MSLKNVDESSKAVILFGDNGVRSDLEHRNTLSCKSYLEIEVPAYSAINAVVYLDNRDKRALVWGEPVGLFDYDSVRELESRMSRIVDAMSADKVQRKALRTIIVHEIWDMYHDRKRLFDYEYRRLSATDIDGSIHQH